MEKSGIYSEVEKAIGPNRYSKFFGNATKSHNSVTEWFICCANHQAFHDHKSWNKENLTYIMNPQNIWWCLRERKDSTALCICELTAHQEEDLQGFHVMHQA